MTSGTLFDLVQEAASAENIVATSMQINPIGYHFEFVIAGQPGRIGWSLNRGDAKTHNPLSEYVQVQIRRIARELRMPDPTAIELPEQRSITPG